MELSPVLTVLADADLVDIIIFSEVNGTCEKEDAQECLDFLGKSVNNCGIPHFQGSTWCACLTPDRDFDMNFTEKALLSPPSLPLWGVVHLSDPTNPKDDFLAIFACIKDIN